MKKQFVKPEIKGIRLRENILAGSGEQYAGCRRLTIECDGNCTKVTVYSARERVTFDGGLGF